MAVAEFPMISPDRPFSRTINLISIDELVRKVRKLDYGSPVIHLPRRASPILWRLTNQGMVSKQRLHPHATSFYWEGGRERADSLQPQNFTSSRWPADLQLARSGSNDHNPQYRAFDRVRARHYPPALQGLARTPNKNRLDGPTNINLVRRC